MRLGLPLAIILHALMFWAGYWVFPHAIEEFDDASIIVPLELVVPDDSTNLAFSTVEKPKPVPTPEVKKEDAPEPEVSEPDQSDEVTDAPVDEPDAPEDVQPDDVAEPDVTPDEVEPDPVDEPEKPEPTPTPKPTPKPTPEETAEPPTPNRSLLERALKTADQRKQERSSDREAREAADLKAVEDANRVERSAGDRQRDTATWTDLLKSKIETKCYRDTSDMANADRLRATYSITFNPDGTLKRPPRRVQPAQIPMGDQQMRVFDINAQRAIEKCAPYNDIFPPELYDEWKDFTFIFGK